MAATAFAVRYRSASGQPLISVTQVLTLAGRIDTQWFTPEAAWRGSVVHALTEAFDRGDPLDIPSGLEGYLEAYASFLAVVRPVYVESELAVQSDTLKLAGRIDRVCVSLFGAPALLDFKTGGQSAWHAQQLALYDVLHPTGNRFACYLGANGKFRLKQFTDPQDRRRSLYDLASVQGTVYPDGDFWMKAA